MSERDILGEAIDRMLTTPDVYMRRSDASVYTVLVDRRHARDCAVWHARPPYACTCGLTREEEQE